jgi:hypothetical protein
MAARQVRWLVGALLLHACASGTEAADPREDLLAAITPELAAQLDASGRFVLPVVNDTLPHISREAARAMAEWAGRVRGPQLRDWINESAGRPVNISHLTACSEVWADPPNVAPPDTVLPIAHWIYGPQWLITLCHGTTPAVAVSVAAYATHMFMRGDELDMVAPAFGPHGDEMLMRGIPADWQGAVALSPEAAVVQIARATHQRVTAVPRLVAPRQISTLPFDARWAVQTETPVRVQGTRTASAWEAPALYVGHYSETATTGMARSVAAASPVQPESIVVAIPAPPYDRVPIPTTPYSLVAQPGMALEIELVSLP